MLVLLSCAKTMSDVSKVKVPLTTVPRFQKEASEIALQMSQFAVVRGSIQNVAWTKCRTKYVKPLVHR